MNTIPLLLADLKSKGINLYINNSGLQYEAALGAFGPAEKAIITANRDEIIRYLTAYNACRRPPPKMYKLPPVPSLTQEMWWKWVKGQVIPSFLKSISIKRLFSGVSRTEAEAAIRHIIARHDTLRSIFRADGGELFVTYTEPEKFEVETADLRATSVSTLKGVMEELASDFLQRDLPVDSRWLTRAKILILPDHAVFVILVINHIVFDLESARLLSRELELLLGHSRESGVLSEAPRIQFNDYAWWEREWFRSSRNESVIDYWIRWRNKTPALVSPEGKKQLKWRPGYFSISEFTIPFPVLQKVYLLAGRYSTSPFHVLLAIVAIAVSRWCRVDGVPIKYVSDMRTAARELASVVGYLTYADVMHCCVSANDDISSVIKRNVVEHLSTNHLRLPTHLRFPRYQTRPDIEKIEFPQNIPILVNFLSLGGNSKKKAHVSQWPENLVWPPDLTTRAGEYFSIIRPPIYLQFKELRTELRGWVQINEDLLSPKEQMDFFGVFFEVVSDFAL